MGKLFGWGKKDYKTIAYDAARRAFTGDTLESERQKFRDEYKRLASEYEGQHPEPDTLDLPDELTPKQKRKRAQALQRGDKWTCVTCWRVLPVNYFITSDQKRCIYCTGGRAEGTREELIRLNGGHHTEQEWEALKAQYDYTCLCCGRREPEITLVRDHVRPVIKGGSSDIDNIQPLCFSCNCRKHADEIDYRGK